MWWKQNKWKVVISVLIVAVLAVAFWYGGGAPGMQGRTVGTDPTIPVEHTPNETGVPSAPGEEPNAVPAPETEQTAPPAASEPVKTPEPETTLKPDPATGKDKYLTGPVPEDKPIPVEPQDVTISDVTYTCTISISCATILDNMDWLDPEKVEQVPEDGWILPPTEVIFYEGESVFNVLQRTCKQNRIHLEFENTPMYNSAYIEGIHNLYEFDCGELSGWMYKVNEWFPNYGCSRYQLRDGDVICWVYTCDLGIDVGGYDSTGG